MESALSAAACVSKCPPQGVAEAVSRLVPMGKVQLERAVIDEVGASFRDAAAGEKKQATLHRWVPWIAGFSSSFVADKSA
jgi:hypothetical protein